MRVMTRRAEGGAADRWRRTRYSIVIALAVTGWWGAASPSHAMPRLSRDISGTVQSIDHKTLSIMPAGRSEPLVFAWSAKRTQFIRGRALMSIDSLEVGTQVVVRYRARSLALGVPHALHGRADSHLLAAARGASSQNAGTPCERLRCQSLLATPLRTWRSRWLEQRLERP